MRRRGLWEPVDEGLLSHIHTSVSGTAPWQQGEDGWVGSAGDRPVCSRLVSPTTSSNTHLPAFFPLLSLFFKRSLRDWL